MKEPLFFAHDSSLVIFASVEIIKEFRVGVEGDKGGGKIQRPRRFGSRIRRERYRWLPLNLPLLLIF